MQHMQAARPRDELPPLLTVKEVAAALRLDPATVYRPRSAATSTPSA